MTVVPDFLVLLSVPIVAVGLGLVLFMFSRGVVALGRSWIDDD